MTGEVAKENGAKTAEELATKLAKPDLIPQPGGRGALYAGGVLGHDGSNAGRSPSEIKQALRSIAEESLPQIREFALGLRKQVVSKEVTVTCPECDHEVSAKIEVEVVGPPKDSDQARVWDTVLKYSLDVKVDKSLVDELWQAVEIHMPDEARPMVKREFNRIVGRRLAEAVVT